MRADWLIAILTYAAVLNGLRFSAGGLGIRIEQITVLIAALLFGLLLFLNGKFKDWRLRRVNILLFLLWAVMLVASFLNAPQRSYSLVQCINLVIISCSYLILSEYADNKSAISRYLYHTFNAAIIASFAGLVLFILSLVSGVALFGINLTQNENDAFGIYFTMREPNIFGCYMMGVFFLSLSVLNAKSYAVWNISYARTVLALVASIIGILFTFTRGVWLATMVGLALFYLNSFKVFLRNFKRLAALGLVAVGAFFFMKNVLKLEIITYKLQNFLSTDVGTGQGRLILWGLALENWFTSGKYVIGNGTYSFASFFNTDNYDSETNAWIGNLYITLLHDSGLAGFTLFILFIAAVIKKPNLKSLSEEAVAAKLLFSGVRIAIICTLIAFFFTTALSMSFCWLLMGLAVGLKKCIENQNVPADVTNE